VGGQRQAPADLLPGKTRYPLYRRLGGPQDRSGRVRKISPQPGFYPRTVQLVTSHYTDCDIQAHPYQMIHKNLKPGQISHYELTVQHSNRLVDTRSHRRRTLTACQVLIQDISRCICRVVLIPRVLRQGCTKPVRQVSMVTKFCTRVPNICTEITSCYHSGAKILKSLLNFRKKKWYPCLKIRLRWCH